MDVVWGVPPSVASKEPPLWGFTKGCQRRWDINVLDLKKKNHKRIYTQTVINTYIHTYIILIKIKS